MGFNRSLFIKISILAVLIVLYLLSSFFYYNYRERRAGEDFLFASFLFRRAAEDSSKYNQAEEAFKGMLSEYGGHWQEVALFYLGNIYYQQGNISAAEKTYARYLSLFPRGSWSQEVRLSLAQLAENRNLFDLAIERYEKLLKEYPENYLMKEVYLGLGRSYERLQRLNLAKKYYARLKANYPGTAWAGKAEERLQEIEARIKLGL